MHRDLKSLSQYLIYEQEIHGQNIVWINLQMVIQLSIRCNYVTELTFLMQIINSKTIYWRMLESVNSFLETAKSAILTANFN